MVIKEKNLKIAIVKTINGEFSIEYANSRDFFNSMKTAIERGSLYEFSIGSTRTIINCKNIVSIEMESEALAPFSPFKNNVIEPLTAEELREQQLAMQPGIVALEAKKKMMDKLQAKEDAVRDERMSQIYGKS